MSLRIKVMAIALGLAVLMGIGASVEMQRSLRAKLDEELEVGVVGVARTIASSLASLSTAPRPSDIEPALWRVQRVNPDVRYVCLVRSDGEMLAETTPHHLRPHITFSTMDSPRQPFQVRRFKTTQDSIREVSLPVDGGWGFVQVGMSEERMHELVSDAASGFLRVLAVIALMGVGVAAIVTHRVTMPIVELARVARAVEQGDRSQRAKKRTRDEVGRLSEAFNSMLDSLQLAMQRNESLVNELHEKEQARVELVRQLLTAQEDERRRISRELHDETAQLLASLLAGLSVMASSGKQDLGQSQSFDSAQDLQAREMLSLTERTMASLRQIALRLRPDVLDSLGLSEALRQHINEYAQRFGFRAQMETVGLNGVPMHPDVEIAIYRIVQEALTNAVRHAQPDNVSVVIERRGGNVIAIVEDDGKGFDPHEIYSRPPKQRLGLFGMEERASLVDGKVTVESAPGKGTTIRVDCPNPPSEVIKEAALSSSSQNVISV